MGGGGRGRRRGEIGRGVEDPTDISLPRTVEEELASVEGRMAMLLLQAYEGPGPARLRAFHQLRSAARLDPLAAYNLGTYLSESADVVSGRRRRRLASLALFERAAEMGLERLRDPSQPFAKAPKRERDIRDIVSRALTNIGGCVSNTGAPDRAVDYFRRSLAVFPGNANAQVCLGNMGIFHGERTGVDPLEGIAAWEQAKRIGDYCHESDRGCPCRENIVGIARQIERDYGQAEARAWVAVRYGKGVGRKSAREFAPVARGARDVARLTGARWRPQAVAAAEVLGELLSDLRGLPLEVKVTLAGSLVGSLSRISAPTRPGNPRILERAVEDAHGVEPLHPFLGDDEWRDLGPPETLHLLTHKTQSLIIPTVQSHVEAVRDLVPGVKGEDAVLGALFHLDRGFRGGVTSMVSRAVAEAREPYVYVPATVVGSPAAH